VDKQITLKHVLLGAAGLLLAGAISTLWEDHQTLKQAVDHIEVLHQLAQGVGR
jgi:hypothetical protein